MTLRPWLPALTVAVVFGCIACSPDAGSSASKARRALDAKKYSEAIAISEAGLAEIRGDPKEKKTIWNLERIRVEALARSGDAAGVLDSLERLSGAFPTHVKAPLFLMLAQLLFQAGDRAAAERVLASGAQRFPDDAPRFSALAASWKSGATIPREECDRLRSIGYLDC